MALSELGGLSCDLDLRRLPPSSPLIGTETPDGRVLRPASMMPGGTQRLRGKKRPIVAIVAIVAVVAFVTRGQGYEPGRRRAAQIRTVTPVNSAASIGGPPCFSPRRGRRLAR